MKKYPYVHQDNSNSCGVACIDMVIRYYKGYVPTSILMQYTHTSRNGTTAYHMIETLKQFGFSATGISCDLKKPIDIACPFIAHVTLNQTYLHYVVVYEINWNKQYVVVADPANQISKMKLDKFYQIYNQILITLHPIQKIPLYHKTYSMIRYTFAIICRYWKIFLPVCIFSLCIFILSVVSAFYISILLHIEFRLSQFLLLLFLSFELCKHIFVYFRSKWMNRLNEQLSILMTHDAFSRMMRLPYLQYHNLPTGDFISRVHDIGKIQEVVSQVAFTIVFDGFLFILSLLFLLILQPLYTIICGMLLLGYLFIMYHFRSLYQCHILALEQKNVQVHSYMIDYVRGFEFVKGLSITEKVIDRFQTLYQNYAQAVTTFQNMVQKEMLIRGFLESIGYLGFLGFSILLYHRGLISVGFIFAYQMLFSYVMGPMTRLVDSNFLLEHAKRSLERIESLPVELKARKGLQVPIHTITCHHLQYMIQTMTPVLHDIQLHWKSGQLILCKGSSGSGKSTLFKCLKGYYTVEKDQFYINEKSYQQYDSVYLDKQILYLSQNETLLLGTLYDNITMHEKVEEKKWKEILQLCEIDSIVEKNLLKYQMLIEENGSNLSGGQRAQIILARTLLKPFQVLLIDEGLEQMDVNLERRILKRIRAKYKDKIIAVISHRQENMDLYDQVIQLEHGHIVDVLERMGSFV